jgi:hypothetical protein
VPLKLKQLPRIQHRFVQEHAATAFVERCADYSTVRRQPRT